ncbi:hypothetical protein F5B19DRAFT_215424 [Rostrohypoxylon terebratum]|nr:hypothetical protein F5B19DRAFT_215424 [Rostrohypoxylon terebratum]
MGRQHHSHADDRHRSRRHSHSHSHSHHHHTSRASRALRTLSGFFGFEPRQTREERHRAAAAEAQRLVEQQRQRLRDHEAQVEAARRNGEGSRIRSAARVAAMNRQRLPDDQIHLLAAIEGARIDRPGHRRLADGLVVRLMKYTDGYYYFLGANGYFYKSLDRYGKGGDLDFVVNTWVPLTVRMFAEPYRQMCRR